MKTRHALLSVTAALLCAAVNVSAESVSEIVKRFDAQKAEALEAYLKATPDAPDASDARDELVATYNGLENFKRIAELLQANLKSMPKGADLPPQQYFGALQALLEALSKSDDKATGKEVLAAAREDVKGHPMADKMNEFLDQLAGQLNKPGVGDVMEIAYTSVQGHKVDLADLKGKVVLVDFWATWCGPCVAELPNVKRTYEAYHDKGFEVVAISLDNEKGKLESFIKENDMPWAQEFSGKGWDSPLVQKFGITSIPATFLIGKDGKVVGADLRGADLATAVEKALGEG
ncbi:MAG: redoxin domain-containing protein [Verrucomicrobiales bacterium]|nr:redoxin domain-containing protein [Verrucomicrobiales bacterium]MCP5560152.1 redoxin domain-containing protein [Verrucomicrobiaceae bacterium]